MTTPAPDEGGEQSRSRDEIEADLERTRDDLLEAETILQDVVQRRRRIFGPAHPDTLLAEELLFAARANLAVRAHT